MTNKKVQLVYLLLVFLFIFFLIFNTNLFQRGHHSDLNIHFGWGNAARTSGISTLYKNGYTDYPPLYLYVIRLNSQISHSVANSSYYLSPFFVTISKITPTLCNFLIGLLIFLYLKNKGIRKALLVSALYWFNLGIIYNSAYWGQVDSVFTLLLFASVLLLMNKHFIISSVFFVISLLTKIHAITLLPIITLVGLLNKKKTILIKMITFGFSTTLLILSPQIIDGSFYHLIKSVGFIGSYPYVSVNAYNFWHFLTPSADKWWQSPSDLLTFAGFSYKTIGFFLLFLYTFFVLYQLSKDIKKDNISLASSSLLFAFFMLPTEIHERYLFPFFAFFSLNAIKNKKFLVVYLVLSVTYLFNLMIVLPYEGGYHLIFSNIQYLLDFISNSLTSKFLSNTIACINVLAFLFISKIGIFSNFGDNIKKDFTLLKKKII